MRFDTITLWTALLPAFGPRASHMSIGGVLKLTSDHARTVERSIITFLDSSGKVIGELRDAFGLTAGTSLLGPASQRLHDNRPRPPRAVAMHWVLDECQTPTIPVVDEGPQAGELTLCCTPVHVPVRDDFQLWVQYVNHTGQSVDLWAAVRGAIAWVDGVQHPSTTGMHWDGRSDIQADGWSRQGFRMSDFAGAPLLGAHEIAVEMYGRRTLTQSVLFRGEPWRPQT
jgi:hypothetical protein